MREQKGQENQLEAHREYLWNQVLDYYWSSDEAKAGTKNPTQYSGGHLRDWLRSNAYMEFNLYQGDSREYQGTNWSGSYRIAMKTFYGVAGNTFVNQYRFKELMKQQIKNLNFGMD